MARYGQRGGDGPNTGRKAAYYSATSPSGIVCTKRTYNATEETAWCNFHEHHGNWHMSGVYARKEDHPWPDSVTWVECKRIK